MCTWCPRGLPSSTSLRYTRFQISGLCAFVSYFRYATALARTAKQVVVPPNATLPKYQVSVAEQYRDWLKGNKDEIKCQGGAGIGQGGVDLAHSGTSTVLELTAKKGKGVYDKLAPSSRLVDSFPLKMFSFLFLFFFSFPSQGPHKTMACSCQKHEVDMTYVRCVEFS